MEVGGRDNLESKRGIQNDLTRGAAAPVEDTATEVRPDGLKIVGVEEIAHVKLDAPVELAPIMGPTPPAYA